MKHTKNLSRNLVFAIAAIAMLLSSQVFAGDGLVCSFNNNKVLRVDGAGSVSVFAEGGNLSMPNGIAVGPDGKVYVGCYGNHSVVRYLPDGTFDKVFANNGALEWVSGLAFGPDGFLYAASQNTHKVYRIDYFGGVSVFAEGNGLSSPAGIKFGPDDKLYVCNIDTDSILRFKSDGTFDAVFASGNMDDPQDIIFGSDGRVYVSSFRTGNIVKFLHTGDYDGVFASNMYKPFGIGFGPDGNFYVSGPTFGINQFPETGGATFTNIVGQGTNNLDQARFFTFLPDPVVVEEQDFLVASRTNNKILRVTSTGSVSVFAEGGDLNMPTGVAFGPDGKVYVTCYGSHKVLRYNRDGSFDGVAANHGDLTWCYGLTFGPDGSMFVGSQYNHKIYRIDNLGTVTLFAEGNGLDMPAGIKFGPDGKLYVCNIGTDSILRWSYDPYNGSPMFDMVFATGNMDDPQDIVFGSDGKAYVSSYRDGNIVKFTSTGVYDGVFATNMYKPFGIAFAPTDGRLYVTGPTFGINQFPAQGGSEFVNLVAQGTNNLDTAHYIVPVPEEPTAQDILVASRNNNKLLRVTTTGEVSVFAEGGDLSLPTGVVRGPDGKVYVASYGNHRILSYNTDGSFDRVVANSAVTGGLDLTWVYGLAFGPDGNLYASTWSDSKIYRVNSAGWLTVFAEGNGLSRPTGLTWGPDGKLYVSNIDTDSVLRFNSDGSYDGVFAYRADRMDDPMDLKFRPDGKLYVTSFRTGAVVRFHNDGAYETPFVSNMYKPLAFVFDPVTSEVYVSGPTFGINKFAATGGAEYASILLQGTNGLDQAYFMTLIPKPAQAVETDVNGAKLADRGTTVSLTGSIVTASFGDYFYIEADNRSTGIRVDLAGHGLSAGVRADVVGDVDVNADGEKFISATTATANGTGSVEPLGLNNKSLGGGDWNYLQSTGAGQKGIDGASGTNNVGLLVRVWGVVSYVDSTTFTISDGSGVIVECIVPSGMTVSPAWDGQYATVTGISSCKMAGGVLQRLVRVRGTGDVTF